MSGHWIKLGDVRVRVDAQTEGDAYSVIRALDALYGAQHDQHAACTCHRCAIAHVADRWYGPDAWPDGHDLELTPAERRAFAADVAAIERGATL